MVTGRPRDERGAGSVLAVAMMGLLVTVTVAAAGVVGVVASHRIAQAAADLAALAGAAALQDGGDACGQAATVADRNQAHLDSCAVEGWNVSVAVTTDTAHLPGGVLDLRATAGLVRRSADQQGDLSGLLVADPASGPARVSPGDELCLRPRRWGSRAPRACTRRACCSAR